MGTRARQVVLSCVVAVLLAGTSASTGATAAGSPGSDAGAGIGSVRLLGEQVIPKGLAVGGRAVGELSGIDRDLRTGAWYLISDDSEEGPARFFTAELDLDGGGLHEIRITGATDLQRTDGSPFPPLSTPDDEVADPEAVRFDPRTGTLYWSSEGKREVPTDGSAPQLVDPWVRQMTVQGGHLRQIRQPTTFAMSAEEVGPRRNAVLEGLALSVDGRQLATSMEGPLYQDGPLPTPDSGAVNRLTWYDKCSGRPVRQVAYPVDAIPATPDPPDAGADNGVTELLAVSRDRYLVLERSFVSGVGNSIRLYEISLRGASNVLGDRSLADGQFRPVQKRLVVDFANLGLEHIDNVEGMGWGPRLPTGERTLVLVSDDNFNDVQVSQVIALAVR